MAHNLFNSLQDFTIGARKGKYYSLAALEKAGVRTVRSLADLGEAMAAALK